MKGGSALAMAALLLVACGYRPSAQTNTQAPSYQADLETCGDAARSAVNTQNAKRALDWFASPVRRWGQIGDSTRSCMAGKGYGSLRWCTADELKAATRRGNVLVTASGVQCTDPPAPERRTPT